MFAIHKEKQAEKMLACFRETVDSILCYKAMFPNARREEIDGYLARLKYHQRFGKSLQEARDLAFFIEFEPYHAKLKRIRSFYVRRT